MIPILYESNETDFKSNGLGRLRDCISCKVTEERNGAYECEFEYPVNGQNFEKIRYGRIIAAEHDHSTDIQPFDIVSSSKPINGIVKYRAVHISYRQSKITVAGSNINSLAAALAMLKNNASPSNPFTYLTDKTVTGFMSSADGVPKSVRSMLGGIEGSILDAYGGEYEWDKFTVKLLNARGEDRNATVRYRVNLLDYNDDTDFSDVYTACVPYWVGSDANGNPLTVKAPMVSSGLPGYTDRTDCVPLDLSEKFETQPSAAQLQSSAISYMNSNQTNLPTQSIRVNFVRLQDSKEYSEYGALFYCRLCDTIKVVFPQYNMNGRFKVVKTIYDTLLERYESMELGSPSITLSQALGLSK